MAHIPNEVMLDKKDSVILSHYKPASNANGDAFLTIRVGTWPNGVTLFFDDLEHLREFGSSLMSIALDIEHKPCGVTREEKQAVLATVRP